MRSRVRREVLARLRWFAEEMPELPVVAAGSLLEFALADFSHSMPVGRVAYAYVEPLGFPEYLAAHGQEPLLERLGAWRPGVEIASAVHDKAWEWFDRYQMAAQQLHLLSGGFTREGRLFHWRREGSRSGKIDYLLEIGGAILPVEVKSGAAGSMKSLHQFMHDKQPPLALRLDRNPPSLQAMAVATTQRQQVRYPLLNLPHYLCAFSGEIIAKQLSDKLHPRDWE